MPEEPALDSATADGRGRIPVEDRPGAALVVLVGLCQASVALALFPTAPEAGFAVGSAGWLLVGMGASHLQGRDAFDLRWHEGGLPAKFGTALFVRPTLAAVLASASVALTG